MKFLCGHCKAKYQIADEKVEGRTLRMTCRQCGREIIIQGGARISEYPAARARRSASPTAQAARSALASDFRRQLAAGPTQRPSMPPVIEQWHVAINDIPVGPMRRDELIRKFELGAVGPDSLAWREGLDDWMPASQIPELAVLFAPPPAPSAAAMLDARYPERYSAAMPQQPVRPSARTSTVPIGGRMVAERPLEDFIPPAPPADPSQQMAISPLARVAEAPPTPTRQMWQMAGPLFAAIGAGAFLIMVGAFLARQFFAPPAVTEQVVMERTAQALEPDEEEGAGVVELDLQEIDGLPEEEREAVAKSGSKGSQSKTAAKSTGKRLSEEEKAMLERMGGGMDHGPSDLRKRTSGTGDRTGKGGGGLKAEQLSKVVSRGKRQLQRCYEAALRVNPTDETIRLDIDINVGMSGKVTSVKTRGRSLGQMNTCIERTIKMWSFPQSGNVTRTSFPVVFQPGA